MAWLRVGGCTCCVVGDACVLLVMRACVWRAPVMSCWGCRAGVVLCSDARLCSTMVSWPVHAHTQCSHVHAGAAENQVRMMADGVLLAIMGALKTHAGVPSVVEAGLGAVRNLAVNGT